MNKSAPSRFTKNKIGILLLVFALCAFSGCAYMQGDFGYSDNYAGEKMSEDTTSKPSFEETVPDETEGKPEGTQVVETSDKRDVKVREIEFDPEKAYDYCNGPICGYDGENQETVFYVDFREGIPSSDNTLVYLFEIASYENDELGDKRPVATAVKDSEVFLRVSYKQRHLFSRFVPALLYQGKYVALSDGKYIFNPEVMASNTEPYPQIDSKKGLLLDANTVNTKWLTDLDVKRVVYNLPLSYIMGETENEDYPTVEFEYDGRVYQYDGFSLAGFDQMFRYLTNQGYHTTLIILNDWNKDFPEIIHPLSRRKTGRSMYYAFNTEEEEGVRLMEATALFLAQRYSGSEYGMIQDWVIANEINQQKIWNYMGTNDLDYYTHSFEKSFRTFYNAIKSNYANAHVSFSIDHDWNDNYGNNSGFFNGKDLLTKFGEEAKKGGDYDWGLAIHPYPNPLPRAKFWKGTFDKSENSTVVTPMNLSVVTDFMQKEDMLSPSGKVRDISITELGFSSKGGEKVQAAAFEYCYYIVEDNEYISSFLLNRQTDDTEALKSGMALGIYNNDYSSKYLAEVFTAMDTPARAKYLQEMLDIIGFDSLEEALKAAR